ncbi:unnamed protein product [Somion occarium]|uniref:3-carboxymuconate cyclase n=1 Tax=Somion occarium TaxID=3059160 RepID=A0ABP1D9L0_9APHY
MFMTSSFCQRRSASYDWRMHDDKTNRTISTGDRLGFVPICTLALVISVSVSQSAAILVSASTISQRSPFNERRAISLGARASDNAQAAIYFMTNDQRGNYIVAGEVANDGSVTFRQAIATGGQGMHGNSTGADGLYSQGSVQVHNKEGLLAVVNAGSHTVSLFGIDATNPVNFGLIGTADSGGEFPNSVAFNKAGSELCVLNTGKVNGVNCYSVDKRTGLRPLSDTRRSLELIQTTPATGAPFTASQVNYNEDENKLIVAVKGNQTDQPGFFAVWDKNGDKLSSTFKKIPVPSGGARPFSLSNIPGKNAVLVADPAVGVEVLDLSSGRPQATSINGQQATCWSVYSAKTGHFYLVDAAGSMVREASVDDSLHPTIIQQYPLTNNSGPLDSAIATVNGKDYLYSLAPGTSSVEVLALEGPGAATRVGAFDFAAAAKGSSLHIEANNVQGMATYSKQS